MKSKWPLLPLQDPFLPAQKHTYTHKDGGGGWKTGAPQSLRVKNRVTEKASGKFAQEGTKVWKNFAIVWVPTSSTSSGSIFRVSGFQTTSAEKKKGPAAKRSLQFCLTFCFIKFKSCISFYVLAITNLQFTFHSQHTRARKVMVAVHANEGETREFLRF